MSRDALVWLAESLPEVDTWLIPDGEKKPRPLREDGLKLLLHLCNRASDKLGGLFWCTRADIKEQTNLSPTSIDRWLAGFEQIGVIVRVGERPNRRGRPTPTYRLTCVPKFATDERKQSDYLPIIPPTGQVKIHANADTASETTRTENGQPKPKPEPEPASAHTAQVPVQQVGLGKERETTQIDDERLQQLTQQACEYDIREHGVLDIPAARTNRERALRETLADFLPRYPDVADDFLIAQAVDLVYATRKGATETERDRAHTDTNYALSQAQQRAHQRNAHRQEIAAWSAQTPDERQNDRERKLASEEYARATLAEMRSKVGRRMPDDDTYEDPF